MSEDVDVVIVAFGAPALLEECLSRLGRTLPVVIVDNSSDADVRAVADRHNARYVDPGRNLGFGAGVNVGVAHLQRPLADVLLLNPDAQITSAAVERLRHCLHAVADLACVAPAQVDHSGRPARVGWPFPTPWGAWVEAVGLGSLRRRRAFMIGSVLLVRSAALTEVGPFDERFFLYAEETDWQRRARDLGWGAALCPEVTAIHVGAGTGGDESERDVHFHASQERYIRKHYATTGWLVYRTGVMVGALMRSFVLPRGRRARAAARFRLYRQGPCRVESEL